MTPFIQVNIHSRGSGLGMFTALQLLSLKKKKCAYVCVCFTFLGPNSVDIPE